MAQKKALLLRIPPDLWEEIRRWADDELRSVNGHIEYLLRAAVEEAGRKTRKPPGEDPGGSSDA
ncbi:Arc family DNA binding domain-containing protein [bacterium]|nr:Arc family DNA binding domain-containing protein [bacterium]